MIETNAKMHLRDPKAIYRGWCIQHAQSYLLTLPSSP
jgi:hypothetical protein